MKEVGAIHPSVRPGLRTCPKLGTKRIQEVSLWTFSVELPDFTAQLLLAVLVRIFGTGLGTLFL